MPDDSNVLDQLVARVDDDTLRTRLAHEVELLRGSRRFGLVFDRHLPESVRLPDHPVRKGIRVALRDETSTETWIVDRFTDRTRATAVLSGDGGTRPIADLVVVREFDEPIYPGLRTVERIENGSSDAPWHIVINGENFHALQALRSTHRGKVDLIYIDPPYNTGNDGWIYNDRYVDQNDRAKSSKWLSFMERRLLIARDLLSSTGVIIVAIGDDEHHRLRMLLDHVFGGENFISDVVWQGGRKNDSRFISNGADYMLVYARDAVALSAGVSRWREPRKAHAEMLAAAQKCWEASANVPAEATRLMKAWINSLPDGHDAKANNRFYEFDVDTGRVFRKKDISWPGGGGPRYDVRHPITGEPVPVPGRGWVYADPARMQAEIDAGNILFGPDHTFYVNRKLYLDEADSMAPESVFFSKRTSVSKRMQELFGDKRFPFPKDHEVLARWIRIVAPRDGIVLDFFGGSGTTTEAVMQLNVEDGGARQSILVTNNEVGAREAKKLRTAGLHPGDPEWEARGVFRYVCRPRISTVVTGRRPDGTPFSNGLSANVEMFDLTYLDPSMVRRGHEFEAVAPLMWLEAGARGPRIDRIPDGGWALTDAYGVLFDIDALSAFIAAVADSSANGAAPLVVFVITDSDAEYQRAVERLPIGVDTVQLYEDYLSNYTINIAGGAR